MTLDDKGIALLGDILNLQGLALDTVINARKQMIDDINNVDWTNKTQYQFNAIFCILFYRRYILNDLNDDEYNEQLINLSTNSKRLINKIITSYKLKDSLNDEQQNHIDMMNDMFNGAYKKMCGLDDETCESCQ